jgi:hypothetical protein
MLKPTIFAEANGSTLAREDGKQPALRAVPLACPDFPQHADLPDGFKLMEAA